VSSAIFEKKGVANVGEPWIDFGNSGYDTGDSCIMAMVRYGNNAGAGAWEYGVNGSYGQLTWGPPPVPPAFFNSGPKSFMLNVEPGGGDSSLGFAVDVGDTLDAGDMTYGDILAVAVESYAAHGEANFNNVVVTFYYWDSVTSSYKSVVSDTLNNFPKPISAVGEKKIVLAPTDKEIIRVVVTGLVGLKSSVPNPVATDLAANIYVWAQDCAEA
jgi:hypothetical protein